MKRIVKAMVRRNVRQACCDFVGPVEQALRRYFAVRDVSEPGSGAVGWGSNVVATSGAVAETSGAVGKQYEGEDAIVGGA